MKRQYTTSKFFKNIDGFICSLCRCNKREVKEDNIIIVKNGAKCGMKKSYICLDCYYQETCI